MLKKILSKLGYKNLAGIFIGLALIITGTLGQVQGSTKDEISEPALNELFNSVLYHVKNEYVDEVTAQKIWFGAIKGILTALNDPHTRFMTPEEYNELQVETRGNFGGLGIEISIRDSYITIVSPIEGTPAMRAGIRPGDKIIEIDKKSTKNMGINDAVKLLRGTPGTSVNISIAREGEDEILSFDLVREVIKIKVVESKIIKSKNIGYIKLKQLSQTAPDDMRKVLENFKKAGVKGVILDLRWNPGGLLDAAHKIANFFIKDGIIVSTRGRRKQLDRTFPAIAQMAIMPDTPMVVLANEGSASASEIVTGALKDLKRGIFVGSKTFGKGSVQNVIPLNYNTAIALTIQKYYTPSGECIHKKGILPDVKVDAMDFNKDDRRIFKAIKEEKIIENFAKEHKQYNKDTLQAFRKLLGEKKYKFSDFASSYLLKQEINKNRPMPIYDLEFDAQLKKAIAILSDKKD